MKIDPFVLLEAAMPIVSNPVCNDTNHHKDLIDNTMICAGFKEEDTSICVVLIYCISDCYAGNNVPFANSG